LKRTIEEDGEGKNKRPENLFLMNSNRTKYVIGFMGSSGTCPEFFGV